MKTDFFAPALPMPDWLRELEEEHLALPMPGDEAKLRFAIQLAAENVRRNSGGPFGAAVFDRETDKLIAVGVNRVIPAGQSWAHAEMTAFARAQARLGRLDLAGCALAASGEPCAMCFGATPWSGVSRLIYGASRQVAERHGFDEGDKVPDWRDALRKRKIEVIGPLLESEAEGPFLLYRGPVY